MKIENVLKKTNNGYYILEIWAVYDSGKKRRLTSVFLKKHEYFKLGGK